MPNCKRDGEPESLGGCDRDGRSDIRQTRVSQQAGSCHEETDEIGDSKNRDDEKSDLCWDTQGIEEDSVGVIDRAEVVGSRARLFMEYDEGQDVGEDEGRVDPAFDAIIDDRSSPPQEHHGQSVVLTGVVPGAPG